MATYSQLPGSMNLAFRAGNEFSALVDFDVDLTGYSTSAAIVSTVTGETVTALTTTLADAAAGQVNVALTETQTAAIAPGTYAWSLTWVAPGTVTRTVLGGFVEVAR